MSETLWHKPVVRQLEVLDTEEVSWGGMSTGKVRSSTRTSPTEALLLLPLAAAVSALASADTSSAGLLLPVALTPSAPMLLLPTAVGVLLPADAESLAWMVPARLTLLLVLSVELFAAKLISLLPLPVDPWRPKKAHVPR